MTTLEALTQTVQAMHGEVQQLMQDRTHLQHAVQKLTGDLLSTATLATSIQAQQAQEAQVAAQVTKDIQRSGDELTLQVRDLIYRIAQLEQQGVGPSASAPSSNAKWDLTRPKDM